MPSPRGLQAYKAPVVLTRVAAEVEEPYRTLLLVHAGVRLSRDKLAAATLDDLTVDTDSTVRIQGKAVKKAAARHLVTYLRGHRARVDGATHLFPLPSDVSKPANTTVAKRKLSRIVNSTNSDASAKSA